MSEHTPTPWKTIEDKDSLMYDIGVTGYDPKDDDFKGLVACLSQTNMIPVEEQKANADFIVKAVNSHDLLVDALTFMRDRIAERWDQWDGEQNLLLHAWYDYISGKLKATGEKV